MLSFFPKKKRHPPGRLSFSHSLIFQTGKILFYENPPEINDTGVKWSEEGKDFYGKADYIFQETDFDKFNICLLDVWVMLDAFYK